MKSRLFLLSCLISVLCLFLSSRILNRETDQYVIQKKYGEIILAYKTFADFLNTDKSWKSYKSVVLDACPTLVKIHNRQVKWGDIDTLKFPNEVKNFEKGNFEKFMSEYDLKTINYLYDSVIEKGNRILPPLSNKKVNLCFFLPYGGGCFVIPEDTLNTICISLYINPELSELIMVHEYSHILHIERRPKEPLSLKREIISEGMAVYLTNRIMTGIDVKSSVPFMPQSAFDWCMKNETSIQDSIRQELNDTTIRLFKRYISDGNWADPPKGFVQKTGYFTGYRIIEKCIKKGMSLEKLCSLGSEEIIDYSGYFE